MAQAEMKKNSIIDKGMMLLEKKRWIIPALFSCVIFIMAIWGIENFNQLLLYDDEFGYWAASAYLTGTDWTSVTSGIPYYSYGYGFLILTPIRLLFNNTEAMYQAAIVVNAFLLVGSYWIARNVTKQLFEKVHWALIDTVCFVVMLYPSNIVFSHIAWAECLLVFMFWVFVWLSLRVIQRPTIWNHVGMAVTIVFLYVVHQRTLAVIIATVMIMIYQFITKKDNRKPIIAFIVSLVVLLFVHSIIKEDLITTFYNNNDKVAINNIGGQTGKIASIFTAEGLLKLIFSVVEKWFYLFVATGMTIWWSAEYMLHNTCRWIKSIRIKEKKKEKKKEKYKYIGKTIQESNEPSYGIFYCWLSLIFAGNFMICAMYMLNITRNDILIYGRYNEYLIGIYVIVGIFYLLEDKKWLNKVYIYMGITFVAAWMGQNILNELELTSYQPYHCVVTSLFLKQGEAPTGAILEYAISGVAFSGIVIILLKSKSWKRVNWIRGLIVVLIPVILYLNISCSLVLGRMTEKQILRVTNIRTIVDWIERLNENADVYYVKDTESRYWSESFQFLLGEKPLRVISSSEISPQEEVFYITGDSFVDSEKFEEQFFCVKRTNQFALVVKKDGVLAEKTNELRN